MKKFALLTTAIALTVALTTADLLARGGRGGGGISRGGGGGRSVSRPSVSRPTSRPTINRTPTVSRPSAPSRPTTRPSTPSRPTQLPSLPGGGTGGIQRPGGGTGLPSQRPGGGAGGIQRPGTGEGGRPTAGDLGNFLKLPPNTTPGTRPTPGDRPVAGQLPGTRPGVGDRPGAGDRPGVGDRPGTRPTYANHAQRVEVRAWHATNIRAHYHNHPYRPWWGPGRPLGPHARWHYYNRYPAAHWYRWATWTGMTAWMIGGGWGQPVYYDYGGNVVYRDNSVYVDGQQAATADEYAQQAEQLAATAADVQDTDQTEWMSLGVFGLAQEEEGEATMLLQMAVSKEGIISGSYHNTVTDQSQSIQGAVDRKTQRAAWTIGDDPSTVLETGIYNLTKDQTPVLVHFGTEKTQTWLMVRLDPPDDSGQTPAPQQP